MGADHGELVLQNLWLLIFIALVNVMSALGQKRTFLDVRFSLNDVRFTPESGHGWQPPAAV